MKILLKKSSWKLHHPPPKTRDDKHNKDVI